MSELENHMEQDCQFTMTSCPNSADGCLDIIQRQQMAEHLEICSYARETCEKCRKGGICKLNMVDHLAVCPQVTVSCAKGCGVSHLRYDTRTHEGVCPQALVTCPFAFTGVTWQGH